MYQNYQQRQLAALNLEELQKLDKECNTRKGELEAMKAKGEKSWTEELQDELNELALVLVDISEVLEAKLAEAKEAVIPKSYTVAKGTEKMVHLSIVRGRRFNPMTGKEISQPYTQLFTFSEWQLFKKNFRSLGYSILDVLHDPYGDAAELAIKKTT